MSENVKIIKVSGGSPVKETAGSMLKCHMEGKYDSIELRAVGAAAVNQMYKALAVAGGLFAQKGKIFLVKPGFSEIDIDGEKKTALIARLNIR